MTRRPVAVAPVTASPITPDQCGDTAIQARAVAMFDDGADPYVDQVGDQSEYWDRLARWLRWKLEKSGKADAAQLDELQYAAEDAHRAGAAADPFAALTGFLESTARFDEARKSGDPRRMCDAYAVTSTFVAIDLLQRTERSKALSAVWAAEAARLGVALD